MSTEKSERINTFCQANKITPFSFLFSVYGDLFSRLSREKKICIAVPTANRFTKKVMHTSGYFVNTVPMALDLTERVSAAERVRSNHWQLASMLGRTDADIQNNCNVMFVFQSRPDHAENMHDEEMKLLRFSNHKSKYEISLSVTYEQNQYVFEWEYMKELFSKRFLSSVNSSLFALVDQYLEDSDEVTERFSMLNDAQICLQKEQYNDTDEVFSDVNNMKHLLETAADTYCEETALIWEGGEMSYSRFSGNVNALSRKLTEQNVRQGQTVALLFERSPEMVIAIHAVIRSGCAYLPLDTKIPPERMKFILENSEAAVLLTTPELEAASDFVEKRLVFSLEDLEEIDTAPDVQINGSDRAYIIYTSGSTGNPKGVVNVHEGIVNRLFWMQKQFPIGTGIRVMQKTPYTFDVSVWEFLWPFMTGATLVIAKPGGHKDPEYICDLINREQINVIHFVPSMLKKFLMTDVCGSCESLKYVICSGEALEADTCQTFYSKLSAQLANLYGPTEAAIDVSCHIVDPAQIGKVIPIGKPISNIKLYKLNDELMFELPEVPGELYISGIGLAEGYLNNEQKTAEAFLKCPWRSDRPFERIYKTGDLVTIKPDGSILYLGRKDFQVKIRGQRVELSEIEYRIKEVPGVQDAVVLARKLENGQQVLVGFVQAEHSDEALITDYLSKYLMEYMIPRVYCFIDEIPVNTNGKADRKKLADYPISMSAEEYEMPADQYEEAVESI